MHESLRYYCGFTFLTLLSIALFKKKKVLEVIKMCWLYCVHCASNDARQN